MVRCKRRCFALIVLFGCLSALFGCGSSSEIAIAPSSALVLPGQTVQFTFVGESPKVQKVWQVNGVAGGSAATGTITAAGLYTAPNVGGGTFLVGLDGNTPVVPVSIFNRTGFAPGAVSSTQNPLVATYAISAPLGAAVTVRFGPDKNYGFSTSAMQSPVGGGLTTMLVAGMRANTTYHMQAEIELIDGSHVLDADQTFTTGSIPNGRAPKLTAQAGSGSPSPGIELFSLDPIEGGNALNAVATDLAGNVIWYYDLGGVGYPFPIKPLANGHMILVVTGANEIREIDLAGNIINRITLTQVNQALLSVASFQIVAFHHDIVALPNGHLILLANYQQSNLPGIPAGTAVLGDVLIDWDPQRGPVWVWSTFDHLDPSRAPYGTQDGVEDWTHANAIIYSPDDQNLVMSLRNQNWIIKINYADGTGDGSILWRFGLDGDFTLSGQDAPIEWNYGQHYPTIVSPNSSGVFSLMFFNNGNNRFMNSSDTICGAPGVGACYSSVPMFQVDEYTKTATVLWEDKLAGYYSICCGDALLLPNGNVEFDVAYDIFTPGFSHLKEVTQTQSPETVWTMDIQGQLAYRGYRIPSLYPGVVWPATVPSGEHSEAYPSVSPTN
jgi:arylsulfate sulfotransferase